MADFLEAIMMVCFGLSWPMNVHRNWVSRSAKGMSLGFYIMICIGYLCGICARVTTNRVSYVLVVYVINLLMVGSNIPIFFRNRGLDRTLEGNRTECAGE